MSATGVEAATTAAPDPDAIQVLSLHARSIPMVLVLLAVTVATVGAAGLSTIKFPTNTTRIVVDEWWRGLDILWAPNSRHFAVTHWAGSSDAIVILYSAAGTVVFQVDDPAGKKHVDQRSGRRALSPGDSTPRVFRGAALGGRERRAGETLRDCEQNTQIKDFALCLTATITGSVTGPTACSSPSYTRNRLHSRAIYGLRVAVVVA